MKLLYFDDFKLGVLKDGDKVVDVSAVVQDIPHTGPQGNDHRLRFAGPRARQ